MVKYETLLKVIEENIEKCGLGEYATRFWAGVEKFKQRKKGYDKSIKKVDDFTEDMKKFSEETGDKTLQKKVEKTAKAAKEHKEYIDEKEKQLDEIVSIPPGKFWNPTGKSTEELAEELFDNKDFHKAVMDFTKDMRHGRAKKTTGEFLTEQILDLCMDKSQRPVLKDKQDIIRSIEIVDHSFNQIMNNSGKILSLLDNYEKRREK